MILNFLWIVKVIYSILRLLNELCMNKLLSMDSYFDYVCKKIIHR